MATARVHNYSCRHQKEEAAPGSRLDPENNKKVLGSSRRQDNYPAQSQRRVKTREAKETVRAAWEGVAECPSSEGDREIQFRYSVTMSINDNH